MTESQSVLRPLHGFILLASVDNNEFVTKSALMHLSEKKTNKL